MSECDELSSSSKVSGTDVSNIECSKYQCNFRRRIAQSTRMIISFDPPDGNNKQMIFCVC